MERMFKQRKINYSLMLLKEKEYEQYIFYIT